MLVNTPAANCCHMGLRATPCGREEIPVVKLGRFLMVKDGDKKANFGLSC